MISDKFVEKYEGILGNVFRAICKWISEMNLPVIPGKIPWGLPGIITWGIFVFYRKIPSVEGKKWNSLKNL